MIITENRPAERARRHRGAHQNDQERTRGTSKAECVSTAVKALRILGASSTTIEVFRHIADATDRAAWQDEGGVPCNYRFQDDMAAELDMTPRHWRRIEHELSTMGAIERATADNGHRGRHAVGGRRIHLGLSLRPTIENFGWFSGVVAERQFHEDQRREALWLARATRRRVNTKIVALPNSNARCFERRLDEMDTMCPAGHRRQASIDTLTSFRLALCALEEALEAHPKAVDTSRAGYSCDLDIDQGSSEMSGAPDMEVRSHIQPTTPTHSVFCNVPRPYERTPGKPGDANSSTSPPDGGDDCVEHKCGGASGAIKPDVLQSLSLGRLKALASEDFEMYLDAFPHPEEATTAYLKELGINIQAWEAAVEQMGWRDAFVSLVVIDRNRFHPSRPVISPGGTLRRFTDLHSRGQLSLTRSIIGIWERDRMGAQPRGKVRRPM